MGGSLLHGLPLVDLPNIYIYIYINQKIGAVGFDIQIFFFILFIFESMHLSERFQTFRKVALWFINTTQFLTEKTFCFLFFLAFSYIHLQERGKLRKSLLELKIPVQKTSTLDSFILGGNHLQSSCTREEVKYCL